MDLKNKVAIVTGGSKGIGRDIALALANEGATVSISDRIGKNLDRTVQEVTAQGVDGFHITEKRSVEE